MSEASAPALTAEQPRRTPFRVACLPCRHTWTAFWIPMPMALAAELIAEARCPMCGSRADQHVGAMSKADRADARDGQAQLGLEARAQDGAR